MLSSFRYDINGAWSNGAKLSENQVLLAFFVPNSAGSLHRSLQDKGYKTLEQYLRAGEKSDHADWADENRITLVKRITQLCARALKDETDGTSNGGSGLISTALANKFGRLVLPPENYGSSGKGQRTKGKRPPKGNHNRIADIRVRNTSMDASGNLRVDFEAAINGLMEIDLRIKTQETSIREENWYRDFRGSLPFPIELVDITFDDPEIEVVEKQRSSALVKSNLRTTIKSEGTITLKLASLEYQPQINIQQAKEKENA